jgi:hypothetical protein
MSFLEFCQRVRACWDALFLSRYVKFLEADNARLRAQVGRLEITIGEFNQPIVATPANNEDFKKIPQSVGGSHFWDSDIRKTVRQREFAGELEQPKEATQEN